MSIHKKTIRKIFYMLGLDHPIDEFGQPVLSRKSAAAAHAHMDQALEKHKVECDRRESDAFRVAILKSLEDLRAEVVNLRISQERQTSALIKEDIS